MYEIHTLLKIGSVSFLTSLLNWMAQPEVYINLGHDCLRWIKDNNYAIMIINNKPEFLHE